MKVKVEDAIDHENKNRSKRKRRIVKPLITPTNGSGQKKNLMNKL